MFDYTKTVNIWRRSLTRCDVMVDIHRYTDLMNACICEHFTFGEATARPMKAILRHAHDLCCVEYAKNNVWHFLRSMCCCCWCCRRSSLLRDYDNTVSPSPVHTQRNAQLVVWTLIYLLAANKRHTYIIWEHVRTLKTKIVAHFLRFSAWCVLRLCITRRAITTTKS